MSSEANWFTAWVNEDEVDIVFVSAVGDVIYVLLNFLDRLFLLDVVGVSSDPDVDVLETVKRHYIVVAQVFL